MDPRLRGDDGIQCLSELIPDGQALGSADERRRHVLWLTGELDVFEARQQLLEEGLQLHAGEMSAETEVYADAEGQMPIGVVAADVEAKGIREDSLVAIG